MNNQEIFARGVKQKYTIPTDDKFTQISWSPDGDCLALGNDNGSCILWSLSTNKCEWRDTGAFAGVRSVAWDHEGRRIGIGCVDGTIQIQYRDKPFINCWEDQGKLIRQDQENGNYEWENLIQFNTFGHQKIPSTVASIHWSTFLDSLLSSHRNGELAFWNSRSGELLHKQSPTGVNEWDNTNSMNPSGNLLAFWKSPTLQVWTIHPWEKIIEIIQDYMSQPSCLGWSRDGNLIALPNSAGQIFIFDVKKSVCTKTIVASRDRLRAVSFSHDGSLLAATGSDQVIRIWSTEDWSVRIQLPDLEGALSEGLAFHPKYNLLAVGTKNGQLIKIFELS